MTELVELSIKDIEKIKVLFKSVFTVEPWNDDWSDEDQLDNYLRDIMEVRTPLILGLYDNGDFIGVSIGNIKHWCRGTEYFIEELCIRTDLQGRGYGTAFFTLIEDYLKERGINQIFLHTNPGVPAYSFYKKLGFTEVTDLVSFFREF